MSASILLYGKDPPRLTPLGRVLERVGYPVVGEHGVDLVRHGLDKRV